MPNVSGRVIAITGASSGIGEAIARRAAAQGALVAVAARRMDRLEVLVGDVRRAGGAALAVAADVASEGDMRRFVDQVVAEFGRLDVMVCNAGIGYHNTFEATPSSVMQRLVDVNVLGTFYAAQAALGVMRRQNSGHLIAVSSIVGRRGIAGAAVYSATKSAQIAFIEAIRAECLGTGIRASVVLPISTATEFHAAIARDFGHTVSGRGPQQSADDVAGAVLRCIEKPRAEVYPYRLGRWLSILNVVAPGFTDRVVRRFGRKSEPV